MTSCRSGSVAIPLLFILVGTLALLDRAGLVPSIDAWRLWPVALIVIGLEELLRSGHAESRRRQ